MDERQRQIQEGAGLQESRLNTELIGWLQKYGTYILYGLLIVVVAYVGYSRWMQWEEQKTDAAFREYSAARAAGNPDGLLRVAAERGSHKSVWELATLAAADQFLAAARRGMAPGADPSAPAEGDVLTEEETSQMYARARDLMRDVLDRTAGDQAKWILAQQARWGIATASISLGEPDQAREALQGYIDAAEARGLKAQSKVAASRIETLELLGAPVPLYATDELPEAARPLEAAPGSGQLDLQQYLQRQRQQQESELLEGPPIPRELFTPVDSEIADEPAPEADSPVPTDDAPGDDGGG